MSFWTLSSLLESICGCVEQQRSCVGEHALPRASYLRDETFFVRFSVLDASPFFVPLISTRVRTAPSILLSVVRYGRPRSEYSRPSFSVSFRFRVLSAPITCGW